MNAVYTFNTCDNLHKNTYYSKQIQGDSMKDINSRERLNEEIRIVFKFPARTELDDLVKKEIKSILISSLQEQLNEMAS